MGELLLVLTKRSKNSTWHAHRVIFSKKKQHFFFIHNNFRTPAERILIKFGTLIDAIKIQIKFVDQTNLLNSLGDIYIQHLQRVQSRFFSKIDIDILIMLRLRIFFRNVCENIIYITYPNFMVIEITITKRQMPFLKKSIIIDSQPSIS